MLNNKSPSKNMFLSFDTNYEWITTIFVSKNHFSISHSLNTNICLFFINSCPWFNHSLFFSCGPGPCNSSNYLWGNKKYEFKINQKENYSPVTTVILGWPFIFFLCSLNSIQESPETEGILFLLLELYRPRPTRSSISVCTTEFFIRNKSFVWPRNINKIKNSLHIAMHYNIK